MGIITGYFSLLFLLVLLAKFIAKRCHLTKLNASLMRVHKYAACGFLVMTILHFILVIPVFDTRSHIVVVSGIIMLIAGILLVLFCHIIKNRKKEIKFHRFFSLIIAVMLVLHIVFYFIDFINYQTALNSLTFHEVNLDTVEDGEYIGECNIGYIYAKVQVTVNNHAITDIQLLEHNHERGIRAESIVSTIVSQQKIDVDAVSGATNSSKVIKMACLNALTN